jgi:hypothetical protein
VLIALPLEICHASGANERPPNANPRDSREMDGRSQPNFSAEPSADLRSASPGVLHLAIKSEGMRCGLPTQLAWPSTFNGGSVDEDDAERARSFYDETLDSRGNKGRMKYFEHRHPVCTHNDCEGPISEAAVMYITRNCEPHHLKLHG